MARTVPSLPADEVAALLRYAGANGRTWKSKLLDAWMTGRDEREPDAGALRRVRNSIGPSGLMALRLADLQGMVPQPAQQQQASAAKAPELPADGAVIVFDVVPVASYCTPGEAYRVRREGSYFYFRNERTGTGTHDKAWAVARSTWRHAA